MAKATRTCFVEMRVRSFFEGTDPVRLRLYPSRAVIEVWSNPLPDGGVVTTYTDVTASVAAQEELAIANETLEGRVKERTRELERLNAELIRAKALAEEANASKTRFLAAASHDILQPLNAARLYASAFAERPRAAGAAKLASHVDGSLEVVEGIISELLDIAKFDAGAMRSEMVPLQLDELLRELEREFAPHAAAKGLKLRVGKSSAIVRTDRLLLRRLLQNLLSNAIKYTSAGGVLVGARRRGGRVVLEVWDSGVGIAETQQGGDLRGVQAFAGRRATSPGTRPWAVDRAPDRRSSRDAARCAVRARTRVGVPPFASRDFRNAAAPGSAPDRPAPKRRPCRDAHRRHRQRAFNSLRHAGAARGVGLRLRRGDGRTRRDAPPRGGRSSPFHHRRLPSR